MYLFIAVLSHSFQYRAAAKERNTTCSFVPQLGKHIWVSRNWWYVLDAVWVRWSFFKPRFNTEVCFQWSAMENYFMLFLCRYDRYGRRYRVRVRYYSRRHKQVISHSKECCLTHILLSCWQIHFDFTSLRSDILVGVYPTGILVTVVFITF